MEINSAILAITSLGGAIFIIAGIVMLKFPPKNINSSYGYRTPRSMENQQTWDFAQRYSAKEMIKIGGLLLIYSILALWFNPNKAIAITLGFLLIIGAAVILIIRVEKAIQREFRDRHKI